MSNLDYVYAVDPTQHMLLGNQEVPTAGTLVDLAQLQRALEGGSQTVKDEFFKLMKCMYNPTIPFVINTSGAGNQSTATPVTASVVFQGLNDVSTGQPFRRALIVRSKWSTDRPLVSLRNIAEGTAIVLANLSQSPTDVPTLTLTEEIFVNEIGQKLKFNPESLARDFSKGRINSSELIVRPGGDAASAMLVQNGQLSAANISDMRAAQGSYNPDKCSSLCAIGKDAITNVGIKNGIVSIQGPAFGRLEPISQLLTGGVGDSGIEYNALKNPKQFFRAGGDGRSRFVPGSVSHFPFAPPPVPGQPITFRKSDMDTYYNNGLFISSNCSLTMGGANIENIRIAQIGIDNVPVITVQCEIPCTANVVPVVIGGAAATGDQLLQTPDNFGITGAASPMAPLVDPYSISYALPAASVFTVTFIHMYLRANGVNTEQTTVSVDVPLAIPIIDVLQPGVHAGNCAYASTAAAVQVPTGPFIPVYTDGDSYYQKAIVSACSRAPALPRGESDWTWVGCFVQGVDRTAYPAGFGGNPATTQGEPWNVFNFMSSPMITAGAESGDISLVAPWWGIQNQAVLAKAAPLIVDVKIEIPKLYDDGNVGPARITTISGVQAGSAITVQFKAMAEVITASTLQNYQKAQALFSITNPDVVKLAELLFQAPGIETFKVNYIMEEYEDVRNRIMRANTLQDMLTIPALRGKEFVSMATSAGLFGSLFSMMPGAVSALGRAVMPGGEHQDKWDMAGNILGSTGSILDGITGMGGMLGAQGMFGGVPEARAAFSRRLKNGRPTGIPRIQAGPDPGLIHGTLTSYNSLTVMWNRLAIFADGAKLLQACQTLGFSAKNIREASQIAGANSFDELNTVQVPATGFYSPIYPKSVTFPGLSEPIPDAMMAAAWVAAASFNATVISCLGIDPQDQAWADWFKPQAQGGHWPPEEKLFDPAIPGKVKGVALTSQQDMINFIDGMKSAGMNIPAWAGRKLISNFSAGTGASDTIAADFEKQYGYTFTKGPKKGQKQPLSSRQQGKFVFYGWIGGEMHFLRHAFEAAIDSDPTNGGDGTGGRISKLLKMLEVPLTASFHIMADTTPAEYDQFIDDNSLKKTDWYATISKRPRATGKTATGQFGAVGQFGAGNAQGMFGGSDDDDDDGYASARGRYGASGPFGQRHTTI